MRERRIVQTEETVRGMEWAVTPEVKEECEKCREAMIESIGRLKYVERSIRFHAHAHAHCIRPSVHPSSRQSYAGWTRVQQLEERPGQGVGASGP